MNDSIFAHIPCDQFILPAALMLGHANRKNKSLQENQFWKLVDMFNFIIADGRANDFIHEKCFKNKIRVCYSSNPQKINEH